ncbi:gag/pol/env polyprotein, putative, partial [Perkinsus marinus ATCC 50983]
MSNLGSSTTAIYQRTSESPPGLSSASSQEAGVTDIRKLATLFDDAPVYAKVLVDLDADQLDKPTDEAFIDQAIEGFDILKASDAGVRGILTKWTNFIRDKLRASSGPVASGEDPTETAVIVFKELLYSALVVEVQSEVAVLVCASLATSAVKKAFRLHRLAELGSARTLEDKVISLFKRQSSTVDGTEFLDGKQQRPTSEARSAKSPNNPHKLPLQVSTPFDGPTPALPYTMFRNALKTAGKFYKLKDDDMVVYIFRNLSPGLGLDVMSDLGESEAKLPSVWLSLDARFGSLDTPSGIAARWERLYMRSSESVTDFSARLRREAHLFHTVTGVSLTLELIAARFLVGLRKEIRAKLESTYSHRLNSLALEELRDAAVYIENKDRRTAIDSTGTSKAHVKKSTSDEATLVTSSKSSKEPLTFGCTYCLEHHIKGAEKHTQENCWKDPANASIVPPWYTTRMKGKNEADKSNSAKVFLTPSPGLFYLKGTSGTINLRLLVDTGADYTLMARQTAERCGVSNVEVLDSPILVGSVSSAEAVRLKTRGRLRVTVPDRDGEVTELTLLVYLVDGGALHELLRGDVVLMGMSTLSRMRADVLVGERALVCRELATTWPLFTETDNEQQALLGLADGASSDETCVTYSLPDEATIKERLRDWQWPQVYVEMKSTAVPPARRDPYPCKDIERKAMRLLVSQLEKDDFIENISPERVRNEDVWVVPAFIVEKHCTEPQPSIEELSDINVQKHFRLVVDERPINEGCSPLPSTWEGYQVSFTQCLESIGSNSWFASLDIKNAYFCLQYHPSVQRYFAFSYFDDDNNVHYALHKRMIMGWTHSASYWCYALRRLLDLAVPEILPYMVTYMDDCLIWHPERTTCEAMLKLVLYAIRRAGAEAPPHKVKGPCRELEFLGMRLGPDGYAVADHTVEELRSALRERPTTLRGLRVKLGLMQFCKSLWSPVTGGAHCTLTHLTQPLTAMIGDLTSKGARRNAKLPWSVELDEVWNTIVCSMRPQVIGFHASSEASGDLQFVLSSDASPIAAAAILYVGSRTTLLQRLEAGLVVDSEWLGSWGRIVGIWTHRWSKAERRYDIIDKELFSLTKALLHWRPRVLESVLRVRGRADSADTRGMGRVAAFTDSTAALGRFVARNTSSLKPQGSRDRRWLAWLVDLADFPEVDLTVRHLKGTCNQLSDILSRLLPGGSTMLAEGTSKPLALLSSVLVSTLADGSTPDLAGAPQEPTGNGDDQPSVNTLVAEATTVILTQQKCDGTTKVYGTPLSVWWSHFLGEEEDVLSAPAVAAVDMGLVRWGPGLYVIRDAADDDVVWSLVVPSGAAGELPNLLSTNYLPDWSIREWLTFVFHDMSFHQGVDSALVAILQHFWWPGCAKMIRQWIQSCDRCLENRKNIRLHSIPCLRIPRGLVNLTDGGKHVAVDFGYPRQNWVPASDNVNIGFICMVCLATGYTVVEPVSNMKGMTAVQSVMKLWVPFFGIPRTLTADNAITTNEFCTELSAVGIRVCRIPSFSPWANGVAEKRIGVIKDRIQGMRIPWDNALSWIQLSLNSTANAVGISPAELMFGSRIRSVADAVVGAVCEDYDATNDDPSQLNRSTSFYDE